MDWKLFPVKYVLYCIYIGTYNCESCTQTLIFNETFETSIYNE